MYILLVEDDELLGDAIQTYLSRFGHTVDWVQDGALAHEALQGTAFDLVLLDVNLPIMSGFEVLKAFRIHNKETPVMVVTAKHAVEDVIFGLKSGADDYIRKPFDLAELLARCEAVSRRVGSIRTPDIVYGDLTLDEESNQTRFKGCNVSLTPACFKLLLILVKRPNMSFSREVLLQRLYGWDTESNVNAIDVLVSRLRKSLDNDIIETVRGVGYRIGSV